MLGTNSAACDVPIARLDAFTDVGFVAVSGWVGGVSFSPYADLLITAAADWRLLASPTTAAFAQSALERHVIVASSTEAGRMLRAENTAAVQWLSDRGRTRLVDRAPAGTYTHHRVETIDAVEVIKAVHSAQVACRNSPTWAASTACRLLAALVTAATHRLPGYADAPWSWTRPQLRCEWAAAHFIMAWLPRRPLPR